MRGGVSHVDGGDEVGKWWLGSSSNSRLGALLLRLLKCLPPIVRHFRISGDPNKGTCHASHEIDLRGG